MDSTSARGCATEARRRPDVRPGEAKRPPCGGPAPGGPWADFAVLEPVRDFKARHASTLLTFDAVVEALDRIEAGAVAAE